MWDSLLLVVGRHNRLAVRATVVAVAYITASAVVLVAIYLLRRLTPSGEAQTVIGFFFIASLSSGLDPATVKAAALNRGVKTLNPRPLLAASGAKALLAAPALAILWRFADPHAPWSLLIWTPWVCLAGFWATDLRALLDLQGRHAAAIWLKQGSLAGGLGLLAALVIMGAAPFWAIGISTLVRVAPVLATARILERRSGASAPPLWTPGLMGDVRWVELAGASVIAAISGSTDRVLGLHFLPAASWATYYLIFEAGSKFWFVPYLLGPIVFARRAGQGRSAAFTRTAWRLTAGLGAVFLLMLTGVLIFAPQLATPITGTTPRRAILAFGVAVVLASFSQIKIADIQGEGRARLATLIIAGSAVLSTVAFCIGVKTYGATGLLFAWLVKSTVELTAATLGARRGARYRARRSAGDEPFRSP